MLQDNLSKIMYVFMLAILLVLPLKAMAGFPGALPILDQTDTGSTRLVAYFDTRDRDSFIQVTNTSSNKINIHCNIDMTCYVYKQIFRAHNNLIWLSRINKVERVLIWYCVTSNVKYP